MNMHTEHRKLLQKIKFHKYVVGENFAWYNENNKDGNCLKICHKKKRTIQY